jgi:hypothetical protein
MRYTSVASSRFAARSTPIGSAPASATMQLDAQSPDSFASRRKSAAVIGGTSAKCGT